MRVGFGFANFLGNLIGAVEHGDARQVGRVGF